MESDRDNLPDLPSLSVDPDAVRNAYDFFGALFGSSDGLWGFISTIWTVYSVIAFVLSAVFIYGIIYSYIRINERIEILINDLKKKEEMWRQSHDPQRGNQRWQGVEAHVASTNPNDWKLAIIEADVMLEKMLEEHGFAGTTIADRLRSASGRSFSSIDDAWQAHRMRNQIAHGGTDFVLTQRMAQATITQYKRVFEEFGLV